MANNCVQPGVVAGLDKFRAARAWHGGLVTSAQCGTTVDGIERERAGSRIHVCDIALQFIGLKER